MGRERAGGGGEEEGSGWMYILFYESVHFLRAIDFDMGDKGEGVREVEVFACWGSFRVCHDGTRDCVNLARWVMDIDWALRMGCSCAHGETSCRQNRELSDNALF